jgi:hypothetical protein
MEFNVCDKNLKLFNSNFVFLAPCIGFNVVLLRIFVHAITMAKKEYDYDIFITNLVPYYIYQYKNYLQMRVKGAEIRFHTISVSP